MTPSKSRPFLVVLATAVASQDGVVAAGDSVRNCRTRPGSKQRLLPVIGYPVPGSYPQSSLRAKRKTGVPACVQPPFSVGRRERKTQPSVPRRSRQGWGESDDLFSRIIFRWWKISLRSEYRAAKPGEAKESHEDFLENSHLQGKEGDGTFYVLTASIL
ncbi:F-box only protein 36 isoform X3 [Elephas maximus indicus]|uniref:F-box only protein 36 isoform X3 n=1 Tax=Elephas maximus indicus TaxID=99487 RepID=UPI0021164E6C|nr:F-box only protein 36 isoform X3 [Elephas maximus indicus]